MLFRFFLVLQPLFEWVGVGGSGWEWVGVGGQWRITAGMRGVETFGGDGSETGSLTKKKGGKKSTIGAGLTPDFRDKEESDMYKHNCCRNTIVYNE